MSQFYLVYTNVENFESGSMPLDQKIPLHAATKEEALVSAKNEWYVRKQTQKTDDHGKFYPHSPKLQITKEDGKIDSEKPL